MGRVDPPCNVGVTCDPEELGGMVQLSEPFNIHSHLPYTIKFAVICTDAQCTDQAGPATQAANTLAALADSLGTITLEELRDGQRQTLASLNPPPIVNEYFTTTFSFQYDPTTSTMTTLPMTQPVQQDIGDYELVGVGYCSNSFGERHTYIIVYDNGWQTGIANAWATSLGCISRCKNLACLNSPGVTLHGVTHGWVLDQYAYCYCLVDGLSVPASCADGNDNGNEPGSGPIENVDRDGYYLCFRPKSI
jgi:hypothetical protein